MFQFLEFVIRLLEKLLVNKHEIKLDELFNQLVKTFDDWYGKLRGICISDWIESQGDWVRQFIFILNVVHQDLLVMYIVNKEISKTLIKILHVTMALPFKRTIACKFQLSKFVC